jgi:Ca2+-binding EF-hand superfamily protein
MFDLCDKSKDSKISLRELELCMDIVPGMHIPGENLAGKAKQLMSLFDKNKDSFVSKSEFQTVTENVADSFELDEYIEVTKHDGTIQKVHKSKLFSTMNGGPEGFEQRNDKMFKQTSESGDIEELSKKDPSLGNMIRIANWTALQIVKLNFSTGTMLNMVSLPNGGSVVSADRLDTEPERLGVKFSGSFEVRLSGVSVV